VPFVDRTRCATLYTLRSRPYTCPCHHHRVARTTAFRINSGWPSPPRCVRTTITRYHSCTFRYLYTKTSIVLLPVRSISFMVPRLGDAAALRALPLTAAAAHRRELRHGVATLAAAAYRRAAAPYRAARRCCRLQRRRAGGQTALARTNCRCGFATVGTVCAYLRYLEHITVVRGCWHSVCYACGLFCYSLLLAVAVDVPVDVPFCWQLAFWRGVSVIWWLCRLPSAACLLSILTVVTVSFLRNTSAPPVNVRDTVFVRVGRNVLRTCCVCFCDFLLVTELFVLLILFAPFVCCSFVGVILFSLIRSRLAFHLPICQLLLYLFAVVLASYGGDWLLPTRYCMLEAVVIYFVAHSAVRWRRLTRRGVLLASSWRI